MALYRPNFGRERRRDSRQAAELTACFSELPAQADRSMDFAQDRIATLHDLADHTPSAPVRDAAIIVPMAEREAGSLAAEQTFGTLESVDPATVVVPLRAAADRVDPVRTWLDTFDLSIELLWCGGDELTALLDDRGLNGDAGKGRDVWLALGVAAAEYPYIVCHDADRRTYSAADVPRLLAPLANGFEFSKGYYARVENGQMYGRLWRLLYVPLVRALAETNDAPVVEYLGAFRYALAGEFGLTADLASSLRVERRFGLEVGSLSAAFDSAGFQGTAQVDLGRYEHDHRSVGGPDGLAAMAEDVSAAVFRVIETHGVDPDYEAVLARYRTEAAGLLDQYAADAAHNGLEYDRGEELDQVQQYAEAIAAPEEDTRLPAWEETPLDPAEIRHAIDTDLEAL